MASTRRQTASAADVSVNFGMVHLAVDFVPVSIPNKNKATTFHRLCPACPDPTRTVQLLDCPEGHGPFTSEELTRRGQTIEGELVEVTAEQVELIRRGESAGEDEDGPKDLTLEVYPAEQVLTATLPGDVAYRLRPRGKKAHMKGYMMLRKLVETADEVGKVLAGEIAVRDKTRLMRLTVWNGQVVAQSLMWPDDIAPVDEVVGEEPSAKTDALLATVLDNFTVDFDPQVVRNRARDRAELLHAEIAGGHTTPITTIATAVAPQDDDLEALLAQMAS